MEEIWKPIKSFEDYQVSNYGNVKSFKYGKGKILKQCISSVGYYHVNLYKNNKSTDRTVHQLVATAFLNFVQDGYKLVVNHKDFNKLNNHVDNLEIVTNRENSNKKHLKSSSQYTGVYWNKNGNKWKVQIVINGKKKHLGYFNNEIDASNAYQNELKKTL